MKTSIKFLAAGLLLASSGSALAAVHYVDVNSTNATPPYTNWATAATNIQDAVDAAVAGDEVVVTNGTYGSGGRDGNRVEVDKPLSVRSANGPQFTTIAGGASQRFRCVSLTNGASLSGFTLTNGFAYDKGGGVLCESGNALVSNCVITANTVYGHVYQGEVICPSVIECYGGGAYGVTLNNCMLSGNIATVTYFNNPIIGCYPPEWAHGGAAYNCTLNDCMLSGNSTKFDMAAYLSAPNGGGADGGGASECTLNNCTLTRNFVLLHSYGVGWASGGGASHCALNNCTLTGNGALSVFSGYGSTYDGGASGCTLNNCINFGNSNGTLGSGVCDDCDSPGQLAAGNNWFGNPLFVDTNGWANLRLQSDSPCVNTGNNAFAPDGPDLDGNPRILGGTVDIGAYEYQSLSLLNFSVVSNQPGFNITGQSNQVVIVEASTNLVNWSPLATNTLSGHPFPFSDPAPASLPQRFYRAQSQ